MPNPNPRKEFLKHYEPVGVLPPDEKLGKITLSVKLGQSVQDAILALPRAERITWMRKTLTEAAKRDLMKN